MTKSLSDLPLVHVAHFDGAFANGQLSAVMAREAIEHGPIFRWVGTSGPEAGMTRVSMIGPEANRFVMNSHRDHFSHDLGWTPLLGEVFGKGLLNMDDPEHARHRRMWNPAFASGYMDAYLPVMQRVIEERTRQWPEREWVDLYTESREITFDIAAAALAGFETGEQVDRLRQVFYAILHGFDESEETWDEFEARYFAMRDESIAMLLRMIHERRNAPTEERPKDVLGQIVHARDENGEALSDGQVLAHLNILLVAGHETTTTLSAWALYLLSTLPEHRNRVIAELDEVLGKGEDTLSVETVRAMKTLDNFVRETGRLYPPVINVPRGVLKEYEFEGYTIPEGTQIRLSLGGCHRLPHVFESPDRFDPDRFAPPREEDKRTPYSLVTFGGGPRVCIGQHFANVETKALLAHVLRNYRLEPLEGQQPVHAGFFNAFIPSGIKVRVARL
ncbi:MAG: cytochrome P450 [Chloroflexia bacterium]